MSGPRRVVRYKRLRTKEMRQSQATLFRKLLCSKSDKTFPDSCQTFSFNVVSRVYNGKTYTCPCSYEHEYFSYISNDLEINMEVLERLCKCLEDGECVHVENIKDEDAVKTTGVSIAHISVVLDSKTLLEAVTRKEGYTEDFDKFLFGLTYAHLAMIRRNYSIIRCFPTKVSYSGFRSLLARTAIVPPIAYTATTAPAPINLEKDTSFQLLCLRDGPSGILNSIYAWFQHAFVVKEFLHAAIRLGDIEHTTHMLTCLEICFKREMSFSHTKSLKRCVLSKDTRINLPNKLTTILDELYLGSVLFNKPEFINVISKHFSYEPKPLLYSLSVELGYEKCAQQLKRICSSIGTMETTDKLFDRYAEYIKQDSYSVTGLLEDILELLPEDYACVLIDKLIQKEHILNFKDHWNESVIFNLARLNYRVAELIIENGGDMAAVGRYKDTPFDRLLRNFSCNDAMQRILKLLLYSNPVFKSDAKCFSLALTHDVRHMRNRDHTYRNGSYYCPVVETKLHETTELKFVTDIQNIPHGHIYILPFILQAGYCMSEIELVVLENALDIDYMEEYNYYMQLIPPECMSVFDQVRSLKHLSRDTLRKHFRGHRIHEFVKVMQLPNNFADIILMKYLIT